VCDENYEIDTELIFDSYLKKEKGAVNKPIFQSTAFEYDSAEELEKVFNNKKQGYVYSRINNPTNNAFEKKINKLEKGIGAVNCASGMSAISTAILSLVESGDEIIAGNSLFGGTYKFLKNDLARWGIKVKFVEATDIEAYESSLSDESKLIFLETMGNPRLDVPDIKAISKIADEYRVPLMVDNTLMTPYLFRPREFGADIVIHSTSKYINGSANSLGGIIVDLGTFDWDFEKYSVLKKFEKYGHFCFLARMRQEIFRHLGATSSPFNTFLNQMGLGTLGVRMDRHCENTMKLAKFLKQHQKVNKINYPGLKNHQFHKIADNQFNGKFGGLLTFELKNKEQCFQVINNLNLVKNLANIGDIRSLIIHPASTIYSDINKEKQKDLGVNPGLLRVSVGIENVNDIIKDFDKVFNNL